MRYPRLIFSIKKYSRRLFLQLEDGQRLERVGLLADGGRREPGVTGVLDDLLDARQRAHEQQNHAAGGEHAADRVEERFDDLATALAARQRDLHPVVALGGIVPGR